MDTTSCTLIIHATPPEQVIPLRRAICDYLDDADVPDGEHDRDQVTLGWRYCAVGQRCGSADDIAAHLEQWAPEATWTVFDGPVAESPGFLNIHVPGLGTYTQPCDTDATPIVAPARVRECLHQPRALRALFGVDHDDALAPLRPRAGETVTATAARSVYYDRHHRTAWVQRRPHSDVQLLGVAGPFDSVRRRLRAAGWHLIEDWSPVPAHPLLPADLLTARACPITVGPLPVELTNATPPAIEAPR